MVTDRSNELDDPDMEDINSNNAIEDNSTITNNVLQEVHSKRRRRVSPRIGFPPPPSKWNKTPVHNMLTWNKTPVHFFLYKKLLYKKASLNIGKNLRKS